MKISITGWLLWLCRRVPAAPLALAVLTGLLGARAWQLALDEHAGEPLPQTLRIAFEHRQMVVARAVARELAAREEGAQVEEEGNAVVVHELAVPGLVGELVALFSAVTLVATLPDNGLPFAARRVVRA
jgi:hypothetical protein